MKNINWRLLTLIFSISLTLIIIGIGFFLYKTHEKIQARLDQRTYTPPVEFYSAPEKIYVGQKKSPEMIASLLLKRKYRRRDPDQLIMNGDFTILPLTKCLSLFSEPLDRTDGDRCLWVRGFLPPNSSQRAEGKKLDPPNFSQSADGDFEEAALSQIFIFSPEDEVVAIFKGKENDELLKLSDFGELDPLLFAQFYGDKPVLRRLVHIKNTPPACLNAVLAIEDPNFLEHKGISIKAIIRAIVKNIKEMRKAEGGSTLTQQMIKNYFLTSEKSYKRKIIEWAMALILELKISKDQILETYLNIIYMGQNGPFVVSGFGAASRHYFGRELEELNLEECALLAAVLNSPGRYNPFKRKERALGRRKLVLSKMKQYGYISEKEMQAAVDAPLNVSPPQELAEPAAYFVDAVRNRVRQLKIDPENGLKIYTTLNTEHQKAAEEVVEKQVARIEKDFSVPKKLAKKGEKLQASLIFANNMNGEVEALVGGRSFLTSPYNRAFNAHRQVGSVIKPLVYLSALEALDESGSPFKPTSELIDEKFTHRYENQSWTPKNYSGNFYGRVPMFYALKNSLNVATAKLGLHVGLTSIIDIGRRLGITSEIKPLPALTLGAYELYPIEVLRAYTALARFGSRIDISFIRKITDLNHTVLFEKDSTAEQVVSKENVATLIGMMKQTLVNGTGAAAKLWGFQRPAAGKTGTTSDTKDAWFAGFTPFHTAIAWVGYDENHKSGLTGASGALPIWANFMKEVSREFPANDFNWPESVELQKLDSGLQMALGVPSKGDELLEDIELVFRAGDTP